MCTGTTAWGGRFGRTFRNERCWTREHNTAIPLEGWSATCSAVRLCQQDKSWSCPLASCLSFQHSPRTP